MTTIWQQTGIISPGGTISGISGDSPLWLVTEAGIFAQSAAGEWESLPYGQPFTHVNALAVCRQTLLAADAMGQIFFSANGGQQWYQADTGPTTAPITWLTLAPNFKDTGVALAGTNGEGVLRTTNGGRNWQPANFGLQDFTVLAIATAPVWGPREVVFLATMQGLYRSPNGGRAWKRADKGLDGAAVQTVEISPDFANDQTVLAGTEADGIFRSIDGGKNWWPVNNGLGDDRAYPPINALWLHPHFADMPLCVAVSGDGQIFHSADGGDVWRRVAMPGEAILCLGGDETNLYAGLYDQGLLHSGDGGQSWQVDPQLAARAITRLRSHGGRLFAFGPLERVYFSADGGSKWRTLPAIADDGALLTLAANSAGRILAATTGGVLLYENTGGEWQPVLAKTEAVALHFEDDSTAWAGTSAGRMLTSTDGGYTWNEWNAPQPGQPIVFLTSNGNTLIAATLNPENSRITLWHSTDQTGWQQWHQADAGWPSVQVVWLGENGVASVDNGCWINTDGGWEKVLETEQPIARLARLPEGLLALTSQEVLFTKNGRDWVAWNDGLPPQPLLDLTLSPGRDGEWMVTVLTPGGRLWQRKI